MTCSSHRPTARICAALALFLAALSALAGSASASTSQESIFQDDRLLQNFGLDVQAKTLDELDLLGVRTVHAVVNWESLAPDPRAGSVPDGFDGANPADPQYDKTRFNVIDQLVRGAQLRGIDVILTPAAPAPRWAIGKDCKADEKRRASRGTCRPNAKLYGEFVTALAKRYSGSYVDENQPAGVPIPKVRRWSLWNEPNLNSWIYPSKVSIRGKHVPISAKIYRDLVYAGGNALRRNGHSSDQILLGETGPLGQGIARTPPIEFYRALFCIDEKGRKLRGSAAKRLGCPARYKRLPVTGVAHHPYTKGGAQKLTAKQHSTDVTISGLGGLRKVLKQGAHVKAITSRTASLIYITEFGVSSTPPAKPRTYGVSLAKQAEYINQAEYIMYRNPAIRSYAQFQLEDDVFAAGSAGSKVTFQTGLRFASGESKAKPSYAAYKVPLFVVNRGRSLTIWGGVRGVPSGRVKVLNGRKVVKTVRLRRGYFTTSVKKRKGTWRLSYTDGGFTFQSRVAKPVKLGK